MKTRSLPFAKPAPTEDASSSVTAARKCIALAVAAACLPLTAHAAPQGGHFTHGSGSIAQSGASTTISASNKSIIQFSGFDIGKGETVRFIQPGKDSTVLNRILSNDPTRIFGQLQSNGKITLLNANGIFFQNGSVINVGGIYAGAGKLTDSDFLAGRNTFTDLSGSVVNSGSIRSGGTVALVGNSVANHGYINAGSNTVIMAAGDDVFIGERESNIYVQTSSKPSTTATAPKKLLASGDLYSLAVVNSGVVKGGNITVQSTAGKVQIGGTLNASKTAQGQGGKIKLLGKEVELRAATVTANGPQGGGEILIGGDFQGKGTTPTATKTSVDAATTITADATQSGNGGKVVVWSNDTTVFQGNISAKGGSLGGDGGNVEVSGKENLAFHGEVNTLAPLGITGTLLLDPANITIQGGIGDGAADTGLTFSGTPSGAAGTVTGADTGPSTIFQSELEGIVGTTNISVQATNNITFAGSFGVGLVLKQLSGNSATFDAGNKIDLNGTSISTLGGDLTFKAGAGGIANIGSLTTGLLSGTITIDTAGSADQSAGIISGAANLIKTGAGTLTLSKANTYTGTTSVNAGTVSVTNATGLGATTAATSVANGATLNLNAVAVGNEAVTLNGLGVAGAGALTSTGTASLSGAVTVATNSRIGGTGALTLSGIISGAGFTLDLAKTAGSISFTNNVTLAALTTAANAFDISLTGTTNSIGGTTSFANTGIVTIGKVGATTTFANGATHTVGSAAIIGTATATAGNFNFAATDLTGTLNATAGQITTTSLNALGATDAVNGGALNLGAVTIADSDTLALKGSTIQTTSISGITGGTLSNLSFDATGAVTVGGVVGTGIGTLTITNSDGTTFQNTVDADTVAISATAATKTVAFNGNTTLSSLTTTAGAYKISLLGGTNSITNAVTFQNTGALTIGTTASDVTTFTGGVNSNAVTGGTSLIGTIQTTGNAIVLGATTLAGNTTLKGSALTLAVAGITGNAKDLTLDFTTAFTLPGNISGVANFTSEKAIVASGNFLTTGTQLYKGNLTLTGAAVINLTGSTVTTQGNVTGGSTAGLKVTGAAVLGNDALDTVTGLTSLEVTGTTHIGASQITTTGSQTYTGQVTLDNSTNLKAGSLILTAGLLGNAKNLTLDVTPFTLPAGITNVADFTSVKDITIGSNFATTGTQTYQGNLTLSGAGIVTLKGATVTTKGTVSGGTTAGLKIDGNAVFGDGIGDTLTGLTSLEVTGTTQLNTNTVSTSGTQLYTGDLTLGAAGLTTLTGSTITTNGALSGGGTASLKITGNAVLGNSTNDNVTGLTALEVTGTTNIAGSQITTTGNQTYTGQVTLAASTTLKAGSLTLTTGLNAAGNDLTLDINAPFTLLTNLTNIANFTSEQAITVGTSFGTSGTQLYKGDLTLTGGAIITLTGTTVTTQGTVSGGTTTGLKIAGNAVFGNAVADTVTGLTSLEVTGTTQLNTDTVTTSGTQFYGNDLTLGTAATTLKGSTVTTNGKIAGNGQSLTIDGNAVFGDATADTVTNVNNLIVNGTTTINTTTVSTNGTQLYKGNLTLAGASIITLTGTTVTTQGTVSGGTTAGLKIDGKAIFGDAVADTVTGLTSLEVTGTTQLNTDTVTTSGTQIYGDDLTLGTAATTLTGGTITTNGKIIGNAQNLTITGNAVFGDAAADAVTGVANLAVTGTTTINTDTVTTTGTQHYTGNLTLGAAALSTLKGTTITTDGNIDGNAKSLKIDGIAVLGDAATDTVTNLTNLEVTGTTQLNTATITTTGTQIYQGDLTLGTAATTLKGSTVTTNGKIVGNTQNLTIDGNAVLGDAAADTVTGVGNLAVTGTTTINTDTVTTIGTQHYTGDLTLGVATLTTLKGTTVTTDGKIDGNTKSLTISGNAIFGDAPADSVTNLTDLIVVGTTKLNTSTVTTSGTQLYGDDLTLGTAATTLKGSTVTTNGKILGNAQNLTIDGNAVLGNSVGDTVTNVNNLIVNGTTQINTNTVTTNATQLYKGDLTLGLAPLTTLTGTTITTNGKINGNTQSLTVAGNAVFGDAAADSVTNLNNLEVTLTSQINTDTITTVGTQFFTGAVTLGAGTTNFTSTGNGAITFGQTLDGASATTVTTGGLTLFTGSIGSGTALTSLTVNGGGLTRLNGSSVTTTGVQLYDDAVSLAVGAHTLSSSANAAITFLSTVNGNGGLTVSTSGVTTFTGVIGNTSALANLTVNGSGITQLNSATVVTSGLQLYSDIVSLGAGLHTLTSTSDANISFSAIVDGPGGLSVKTGGVTNFDGEVGSNSALASLTTDVGGSTRINTGRITTSGVQTYNDAVQITQTTDFAGSDISILKSLTGPFAVTFKASGDTTLSGNIKIGSLLTDSTGKTILQNVDLSTKGTQKYKDVVVVNGNSVLTDTASGALKGITFSKSLSGSNLTINALFTDISYLGSVNLNSLTTHSATTTFTGEVTGGDYVISTQAGDIIFLSPVDVDNLAATATGSGKPDTTNPASIEIPDTSVSGILNLTADKFIHLTGNNYTVGGDFQLNSANPFDNQAFSTILADNGDVSINAGDFTMALHQRFFVTNGSLFLKTGTATLGDTAASQDLTVEASSVLLLGREKLTKTGDGHGSDLGLSFVARTMRFSAKLDYASVAEQKVANFSVESGQPAVAKSVIGISLFEDVNIDRQLDVSNPFTLGTFAIFQPLAAGVSQAEIAETIAGALPRNREEKVTEDDNISDDDLKKLGEIGVIPRAYDRSQDLSLEKIFLYNQRDAFENPKISANYKVVTRRLQRELVIEVLEQSKKVQKMINDCLPVIEKMQTQFEATAPTSQHAFLPYLETQLGTADGKIIKNTLVEMKVLFDKLPLLNLTSKEIDIAKTAIAKRFPPANLTDPNDTELKRLLIENKQPEKAKPVDKKPVTPVKAPKVAAL